MSNSPATKRIAILISGRGSNMVALADAVRVGTIPNAEVAIVISDKRDQWVDGSPKQRYGACCQLQK